MELTGMKVHFLLCNGASCTRNGAEEVTKAIRQEIQHLDLGREVHTTKTLCNGRCKHGPIVVQYPAGEWYQQMDAGRGKELVRKLMQPGMESPVPSYIFRTGSFISNKEYNSGKEGGESHGDGQSRAGSRDKGGRGSQ
ncbi:ferredoxin [Kroppenstedtia eburnea]|uniref:(2Fe-2S) ferredoxin n=1 Tax=Kroppenstedtia eburnea TaxID=714067 RepID=A0A1N7LK36_9BACL|nr:(2Fe-2S) ferredoxin domain-containing protein [Kroppenstedtia eburnea]SIS74186.1 (2Fe-2S) ferredoxin [Kroppenstedtia eburnea]